MPKTNLDLLRNLDIVTGTIIGPLQWPQVVALRKLGYVRTHGPRVFLTKKGLKEQPKGMKESFDKLALRLVEAYGEFPSIMQSAEDDRRQKLNTPPEKFDPIDPYVETPAWTVNQTWCCADTVDEIEQQVRKHHARRHASVEEAIQYAKTWQGSVALERQPDNTLKIAYANWDSS